MDDIINININELEWWAKPIIIGILAAQLSPEELKRYAELAGMNQPQESKDKKPLS